MQPYKKRLLEEEGEIVTNNLPYARPRKKANESIQEALEHKRKVVVEDASKLVAAHRIIDSFNDGDCELLVEIIKEVTYENCIIDLKPLNKRFEGIDALIYLWKSLFEAFPDGNFQTYDSCIDCNLDVTTPFMFTGVKILPINLHGGYPISSSSADIKITRSSKSSLVNPTRTRDNRKNEVKEVNEEFKGIQQIVTAFLVTDVISDATEASLSAAIDESNNMRLRASSVDQTVMSETDGKVLPIYTSNELLVTEALDKFRTRGKIVAHVNTKGLIKKYVFDWDKLC